MAVKDYASVEIRGNVDPALDVLTPEAIIFLQNLHDEFEPERQRLLKNRIDRQQKIDDGELPSFLNNPIRSGSWKVKPVPKDLQDRRVEITGPTDRKMVINALNSGAKCFMADFEDSNSPTWNNLINGQTNLTDAINRTIEFTNPKGKKYSLNENTATLLVRPRGWHLNEKHFLVGGTEMSGSLFDFGLYFFRNAHKLLENGSGPYFYLPKLQNHEEARLWNEVFCFAQGSLKIEQGTIKATVLIEHILAAFETEEILYELRDHSSGLNCGRWDYIFSYIKTFRNYPDRILPDRSQVTMATPFMAAYCKEVIRACHKRGAHAMGGMAAQIPIKNDPAENAKALKKVQLDKEREMMLNFDGTWVAHPGLIYTALKSFERMTTSNQIGKQINEEITAEQILKVPKGTVTEEGVRININVGVRYLQAWMNGNGCVPLYNLMEDCATCEICKVQIWQWLKHNSELSNGKKMGKRMFALLLAEELKKIEEEIGTENYVKEQYSKAADLFSELSVAPELADFLTIPAYQYL